MIVIFGFCLNQSETRTGAHSTTLLLDVIVESFLHTVVPLLQIYQAQEKSYRLHKVPKH